MKQIEQIEAENFESNVGQLNNFATWKELKQQLETLEKLLAEAAEMMSEDETAPNGTWWKRFFLHDGAHMVLCEQEGWVHGDTKKGCIETYGADSILDEVNAPTA